MLRILCRISIYGNKKSLDELILKKAIPNGSIEQVGIKRKIPDIDKWCYSSPTYQFNRDNFDAEVCDFLSHHLKIGDALSEKSDDTEYALLSICPVGQKFEDEFSCLLSRKTLDVLSKLRLSLEIAPEVIMPEFSYWLVSESTI